jgi:hypothetical protein
MVIKCPLLRKCKVCGEHKPQTDFYKITPPKRAKQDILGNGRISRCRSCEIDKYVNLDAKTKMLYAARARAKKLGVECTITKDDIFIPDVCPVLGTSLVARAGGGRPTTDQIPNSPSLDRIVNHKGYVPGNVAVISFRANLLKRDATIEELQAILDYMKSHTS